MIFVNRDDISTIVAALAPALLGAVPSKRGVSKALLTQLVGQFASSNVATTSSEGFAIALKPCLDEAARVGATAMAIDGVRALVTSMIADTLSEDAAIQTATWMLLAAEARLIAVIEFTSRDDVNAAADWISAAFDAAAEKASDDMNAGAYTAIVKLQAEVVKYLADVGRVLPRVVKYHMAEVAPTLAMSQRFYHDGTRSGELHDENKIIHPAFAPVDGIMLAV